MSVKASSSKSSTGTKKSSSPSPKSGTKPESKSPGAAAKDSKPAKAAQPKDTVKVSDEAAAKKTAEESRLPDLESAFGDISNLGVLEREPETGLPTPELGISEKPEELRGLEVDGPYRTPTDGGIGEEGRPHAVVVDFFESKSVDVDNDGIPDGSHGGTIARAYHNNGFATIGYDAGQGQDPKNVEPGRFYEGLVNDLKSGELDLPQGSVISSSWGIEASMSEYSERFGMDLTPENLKDQRGELMDKMKAFASGETDLGLKGDELQDFRERVGTQVTIADQVSELQNLGFNVISAAENNPKLENSFHPHAMFDDYHAYAVNSDDEQYFPDAVRNSITQPGPGVFTMRDDPQGGISTNGDHLAEFPLSDLSSGKSSNLGQVIAGSSLAPPFIAKWMNEAGNLNPDFRVMDPAGPVPAF